jgi:hypothetical protein
MSKYRPATPGIDAEIRRVYQEEVGMGSCMLGESPQRELAYRLGWPRWKVTRRAQHLGLITKTKKQPDWSEQELIILEHHAHKIPEVIQRYLKRYGFERSVTAIVLKRKRMRCLRNLEGQSATDLALCFGVDMKTVQRWILTGYLKAKKRGTHRTEQQGGDMWWIKERDIVEFVKEYVDVIDLRKVDKWWFVGLLTAEDLR